MEILIPMIICSISLALIFLLLFIYGVIQGQFEDDESPSIRMLNDSTIEEHSKIKENNYK